MFKVDMTVICVQPHPGLELFSFYAVKTVVGDGSIVELVADKNLLRVPSSVLWLPQFKIGDKVICATPDSQAKLQRGAAYTISSLPKDKEVNILEVNSTSFFTHRFITPELANCQECKGSGNYVGFSVIETCRCCAGKGRRV